MRRLCSIFHSILIKYYFIRLFITGFSVFFLLSVSFYSSGIYPFGVKTIAWGDMKQQVVPLLLQFNDILTGNQSIFFHTGNSGGGNFWGIFFFFLSSPFSYLFLLSDKVNPFHLINLVVLSKFIVTAITSTIMFDGIFPELKKIYVYALSVSYVFCGFSLMFYQNAIWLDMLYLLPLLILGMHKLTAEGKSLLYTVILSFILVVNYYMSYMIVLFIIFYFAVLYFTSEKNEINKIPIVLISYSTILPALISAFVWLPSFMQYLDSSRDVNILNSLSRGGFISHYETTVSTILSSPVIFLIIPFIIVNLKKSNIPYKWLVLFFITLVPLFIEPINKMWHTGSYQAFPARYSYITVLIGLIVLAHYLSENNFTESIKYFAFDNKNLIYYLIGLFIALTSIILMILHVLQTKTIEIASYVRTLWASGETFIILLFVFFVFSIFLTVLYILFVKNKINSQVYKIFLITLLLINILFNLEIYFGIPANSAAKYSPALDIRDNITIENLSRVKLKEKYFDVNLTGGLGYPSLATYTSLTSTKYLTIMKKLGFSSYWMEVSSSQGTKFSDALMSNRYTIITSDNDLLPDETDIIYRNNTFLVSENSDVFMPAIPITKNAMDSLKSIPDGTRFDIQNYLFTCLTGNSALLLETYIPDEKTTQSIHYKIDIADLKILYFDYFNEVTNRLVEPINDTFKIHVNGKLISDSYPNKRVNGILELGAFENETVIVDIEILKPIKVETYGIAGLDTGYMINEISKINLLNPVYSIKQNRNSLELNLNESNIHDNNNNNYTHLMLTIPYSGNITAYSGAEKLEVLEMFGGFCSINIPENKYSIKIVFKPEMMNESVIISISAFVLAIILFIFRKDILNSKIIGKFSKVFKILFLTFSVFVFLIIYIFPIAVFLLR